MPIRTDSFIGSLAPKREIFKSTMAKISPIIRLAAPTKSGRVGASTLGASPLHPAASADLTRDDDDDVPTPVVEPPAPLDDAVVVAARAPRASITNGNSPSSMVLDDYSDDEFKAPPRAATPPLPLPTSSVSASPAPASASTPTSTADPVPTPPPRGTRPTRGGKPPVLSSRRTQPAKSVPTASAAHDGDDDNDDFGSRSSSPPTALPSGEPGPGARQRRLSASSTPAGVDSDFGKTQRARASAATLDSDALPLLPHGELSHDDAGPAAERTARVTPHAPDAPPQLRAGISESSTEMTSTTELVPVGDGSEDDVGTLQRDEAPLPVARGPAGRPRGAKAAAAAEVPKPWKTARPRPGRRISAGGGPVLTDSEGAGS